MRRCYLAVHTAVSAIIYLKLRGMKKVSSDLSSADNHPDILQFSAAVSSVLFYLFVPGNIMAMSYNTLGIDCYALFGLFLSCGIMTPKLRNTQFAVSGLFFAAAVLCCPYLALIYAGYAFMVLIIRPVFRKKDRNLPREHILHPVNLLFFTLGAAVPAIIFSVFFFSRAGIKDIFRNLPLMLLDPEHQNTSFFYKLPRYFSAVFLHGVERWKYILPLFVIELIVLAADQKRFIHKKCYFTIACALSSACYIAVIPTVLTTDFTAIVFPVFFPSVISYILIQNKPKAIFEGIFVPGILYSFCLHMSSNQAFFVISMAISISNIAGIIFIGIFLKEAAESECNRRAGFRCCAAAGLALASLYAGFLTFVRAEHTFRDGSPSSLDIELQSGPAKGVITNQNNAFMYHTALQDLKYYSDKPDGNILILVKEPWYYLETYGKSCASYSAWIAEEDNNTLRMLDSYYTQNPEKTPKYIYISKYSQWDIDAVVTSALARNYSIADENELSIKLESNSKS